MRDKGECWCDRPDVVKRLGEKAILKIEEGRFNFLTRNEASLLLPYLGEMSELERTGVISRTLSLLLSESSYQAMRLDEIEEFEDDEF